MLRVNPHDVKSMVEALDGALDCALEVLTKSFAKYKMTNVNFVFFFLFIFI